MLALPRRRFDESASRLTRALFVNTQKKRVHFEGRARQLSPRLLQRRFVEQQRTMSLLGQRLPRALEAFLRERRTALSHRGDRLVPEPILRRTRLATSTVEQLDRRRDQAVRLLIERAKRRGQELERLMRTLSYESVLDRGFAIVFDADGHPVKQAAGVAAGDALSVRFRDGDVAVVADGGAEDESAAKPGAPKKPASARSGGQGSLF